MFRLEQKVVVVTGSGGLLGKAICKSLEEAGAQVIGIDIVSKGGSDGFINADVTDEGQMKAAIASIIAKKGRIDGWVNNAYPRTADWGNKLEDISMDSWRKNVDLQMNSYFMCSRLALQEMARAGSGSLVNMSSIYGVVGPDFNVYAGTSMTTPAAYTAIKGGIVNLTRYLAAYFGPHGLRANCISPGGIFDHQPESFVNSYCSKVPMKRMGKPEDIGPSVVFLLSDEASYITGHNLMVDGGWTAI